MQFQISIRLNTNKSVPSIQALKWQYNIAMGASPSNNERTKLYLPYNIIIPRQKYYSGRLFHLLIVATPLFAHQ